MLHNVGYFLIIELCSIGLEIDLKVVNPIVNLLPIHNVIKMEGVCAQNGGGGCAHHVEALSMFVAW